MNEFVVVQAFKQFIQDGDCVTLAKRKTKVLTGLSIPRTRDIIKNSKECQELIKQKDKARSRVRSII